MSRKIGLGDTYFDPDINGDIDFDFFGGTTADSTDGLQDASYNGIGFHLNEDKTEASASMTNSVPHRAPGHSYLMGSNTMCDKSLDSYLLIKSRAEERISSERISASSTNATAMIVPRMMTNREGAPTSIQETSSSTCQVDSQYRTHLEDKIAEGMSAQQILAYRNHDEGEVVSNKSMVGNPPLPQHVSKEDDDDEEDDDDSASDLYSLTDEDEYEDDDNGIVNEEDLDSDITEVSPLSSANMSPLPESPKRTPEPKTKRLNALVSNSKLAELRRSEYATRSGTSSSSCCSTPRDSMRSPNRNLRSPNRNSSSRPSSSAGSSTGGSSRCQAAHYHKQDPVDLQVLTKAIMELEAERRHHSAVSSCGHQLGVGHPKPFVKPRKNMTFTSDEVRRIDLENKRLLRKIIDSQRPRKHSMPATGRVASSAVNRLREHKKIETENLVLLKRLQAAKPTKELSRDFLLRSTPSRMLPESKSSSSIASSRTPSSMATPSFGAKGRGGRCLSTGSLSSTASNTWLETSSSSVTKDQTPKSTANGLTIPQSIASG